MACLISPSSLRILIWNAHGLLGKLDELQAFADKNHFDVMLITETLLKPEKSVNLPNYTISRADRVARGGGVAVFVRKNIRQFAHADLDMSSLEAVIAVISMEGVGKLGLVAAYIPPHKRLPTADLETLFSLGFPLVVGGDFNCKSPAWNSRKYNTKGRHLESLLSRYNRVVALGPDSPTTLPFKMGGVGEGDVLDIALLVNITIPADIITIDGLSSDHQPVVLQLGTPADHPLLRVRRHISWPVFSKVVDGTLPPRTTLSTEGDIDRAVESLTSIIQGAVKTATIEKRISSDRSLRLPVDIEEMIRHKNRLRRRWANFRDPSDKHCLNRVQHQVRDAIRAFKNSIWEGRLHSLSEEDDFGSLWRITKALKRRPSPRLPILQVTGRPPAVSSTEKAELFASTFEEQFTPNPMAPRFSDFTWRVHTEVAESLSREFSEEIRPTTLDEVTDAIKLLKRRKAPGDDSVSNTAIRALPERGRVALVDIINATLKLCYFPRAWKCAVIITIHKAGKTRSDPSNYRPISLLSSLGKLLERVIHTRLGQSVDELDLVPPFQHGFRKDHSTLHQLSRIVEFTTTAFNWRQYAGGVFLDIAKAFDKVWQKGLLWKIAQHNLPSPIIKLLASYLANRSFRVRVGGVLSVAHPIKAGVPQGSILGPLLYNIFVADMPTGPASVLTAQYADDTALITRSLRPDICARRLQDALDRVQDWFVRWRIAASASKSSAVIFTRKHSRYTPSVRLRLGDDEIPWDPGGTKYLGVFLDRRLTFETHFRLTVIKARKAFLSLYPLFASKRGLDLRNKVLLYKATIRPIFTYAAPIWRHAAASHLYKLQVAQNKFLRVLTGAPWFLSNESIRRDLGVETVESHVTALSNKFYATARAHYNQLISEQLTYSPSDKFRYRRPMSDLSEQ